ncbi:hypothetical protein PsAD14_01346 [Pseudovibrio sp. Ad14]|nr:hypothetical protein PsW74_05026 [Pseudovibrio sp. W74]KZL09823.1 hypothetical protein PsAD14_01346 [Pseudovibrio sp. Ad14]
MCGTLDLAGSSELRARVDWLMRAEDSRSGMALLLGVEG